MREHEMTCGDVTLSMLQRRIRVARGEEPGDLVLTGGAVVNVFTERVETANVVITDGWIAGVGPFAWEAANRQEIDGYFVLPGLFDAHVHLESTLLTPDELARLVVPLGTSTMIADPHEVANVLGEAGVRQLLSASRHVPLDLFFLAPSCVPATEFEDSAARLDAEAIGRLLEDPRVLGLGEVMNFPGVLCGDPSVLGKVVTAWNRGVAIDGHAPGVCGRDLVAYAAAGIGADHESTEAAEAIEKAALGITVQVREGSSERNLDALLPPLVAGRLGDWCLATDDLLPTDIVRRGHINTRLQRIIRAGVPAPRAIRHATLVPARHYGLADRGAVAPAYRANLAAVSDLEQLPMRMVIHDGHVVARDGQYCGERNVSELDVADTVHLAKYEQSDFILHPQGRTFPVVRLVPDQIVTAREDVVVPTRDGQWAFTPDADLALVASVERHRGLFRRGLGLVRGFGFQRRGAIGASVAHDSHNLIVAGTDAADMLVVLQRLEQLQGGLVVVADGQVLAQLPLPFAGLISTASAETVCQDLERLLEATRTLGCNLPSPFTELSFLALPVIPRLRVTTRGIYDVQEGRFLSS